MKKIISSAFLIAYLSCHLVKAQGGEWTWMKGDSTVNDSGHYGTQGVADPANAPPARYSPSRWTDHNGDFWIYGGYNIAGFLGDLWRYSIATNEWTWMAGTQSTNLNAVYGTEGIPSPDNFPGCRGWGGASWVDANGDLWLYGSKGYGSFQNSPHMLSDLWKFTIATNEWTWMSGTATDETHYGTLQTPASDNTPGMRMEVAADWTDSTGLWFYGGLSNDMLNSDRNDMWRYDISINKWAWMSGDTVVNVYPVLGTKLIYSPANTPGGRMSHCAWKDSEGKFWFFGGHSDYYGPDWADLWKYEPQLNQWAWQSGSIDSTGGLAGNYCDTSKNFLPQGRWEHRLTWIDDCDNLWLFGGQLHANTLGDLWVYSTLKNAWSYVSGTLVPNNNGEYGTQGIGSNTNHPPTRVGSAAFKDMNGNFWLFAGAPDISQTAFLNDLWKYVPDPDCPPGFSCDVADAVSNPSLNPLLNIFPNPSAGFVKIQWPSPVEKRGIASSSVEQLSLRIINAYGQSVYYSVQQYSYSTQQEKLLDLSALSNGVYLMVLDDAGFTASATFIISK